MRDIMERKKAKEILKQFQCDYNRNLEESFACTFSENNNLRLFFINENKAFTDGRNIIVDPAYNNLYFDQKALLDTEKYLDLPENSFENPWNVLRIITRGQTIHECLHILYSDFSNKINLDPRCNTINKKKTMAMISNIIEDAYIEAVGTSVYDNIDTYLMFLRISIMYSNFKTKDTASTTFQVHKTSVEENSENNELDYMPLILYLNYMGVLLLYPMLKQKEASSNFIEYYEKTKDLFLKGCTLASPKDRYSTCQQIFDIILPLIPEDELTLNLKKIEQIIGGCKTHSINEDSISTEKGKGKTQEITTRLFVDINGNPKKTNNKSKEFINILSEFEKHNEATRKILIYEGYINILHGINFDSSVLHNEIEIKEIHPKINLNMKKAYDNLYKKYRLTINTYNNRFQSLLEGKVSTREEKLLFGYGINSKMIGDSKRRYWYKNNIVNNTPQLAILLLIDGSGSMAGNRRDSTIIASLIMHEVLKKQEIPHAIIEHRACFEEPEIDINVLIDFKYKNEEKLNLMEIDSYGDNRDGLALFWAEKYMKENETCENRLIIVLSDGLPSHEVDNYYPPISTKDTKNAVIKITNRGTNIIGISLDDIDSYDCYDGLKEIYPNLISCNDLNKLTGQIFRIISKELI